MHRPLDPNTGRPVPVAKEDPGKGSAPPKAAPKPKPRPRTTTTTPQKSTTTKEK